MKRIGTRLTYANVVASLALFVALAGGTAFAASKMLPKNSVGSKQIKKGAITPSKLSQGSKTALVGPKGATGAQGSQGDRGPVGPQGPQGAKGDPGESAVAPLSSGKSESGFYAAAGGGATGGYITQGITFRQPLATKIAEGNAEWLQAGETSPSCPGLGQAAPGHLCVYANEQSEVSLYGIYDSEYNDPAADKNGFVIYWTPLGVESYVDGEYTVTAP